MCPLHLALMEILPFLLPSRTKIDKVLVSSTRIVIEFREPKTFLGYRCVHAEGTLPEHIQDIVCHYDDTGIMSSFLFSFVCTLKPDG